MMMAVLLTMIAVMTAAASAIIAVAVAAAESSVFSSPDMFASDIYVWRSKYAEATKNKKHVEEDSMKLFYLFLNQCSPLMITELKSTAEFKVL